VNDCFTKHELVLSSLKETHVCRYGLVLFMHHMALSFIERFFWKEVCVCLVNADIKLIATCFWLSTIVKLLLVSMIIWLKTCVYDRFIEHAFDTIQI
jgi:type IV secretory pathway TrbL component